MPQELTMKGSATRMTMWLRWGLYGLVMVLAPMWFSGGGAIAVICLLYTSPSPRD